MQVKTIVKQRRWARQRIRGVLRWLRGDGPSKNQWVTARKLKTLEQSHQEYRRLSRLLRMDLGGAFEPDLVAQELERSLAKTVERLERELGVVKLTAH